MSCMSVLVGVALAAEPAVDPLPVETSLRVARHLRRFRDGVLVAGSGVAALGVAVGLAATNDGVLEDGAVLPGAYGVMAVAGGSALMAWSSTAASYEVRRAGRDVPLGPGLLALTAPVLLPTGFAVGYALGAPLDLPGEEVPLLFGAGVLLMAPLAYVQTLALRDATGIELQPLLLREGFGFRASF